MKKGIYRLTFDCGRMGMLEGIFVAPQLYIDILVEREIEVYFGEVLGKHSDVYGPIEEMDIDMVSDSEEAIKVIEELGLESGYNPLDYHSYSFEYDGIDNVGDLIIRQIIEKIIEIENL